MDPDLAGRPFYQLRNTQIRDQTDDRSKSDQQVQLPEPLPIYKMVIFACLNFVQRRIFFSQVDVIKTEADLLKTICPLSGLFIVSLYSMLIAFINPKIILACEIWRLVNGVNSSFMDLER